jgi:hypothetical protein
MFARFSISFFPKEFEVGHASGVNHVHRCRIECILWKSIEHMMTNCLCNGEFHPKHGECELLL